MEPDKTIKEEFYTDIDRQRHQTNWGCLVGLAITCLLVGGVFIYLF